MTSVRDLHNQSMKLAQLALVARNSDDLERAIELARQAYKLEAEAAAQVPESKDSEPTRSILYRSAASLAYQCREFRVALQLIAKGLSGFPPPKVEQELQILYEQVVFELNLQSHGITLSDEELSLSMKGKAIGFGHILYNEFLKRVDATFSLVDRTVQRKMGRLYQRSGRISTMYRPFTRVLSGTEAGSFIVKLKLGQHDVNQTSFFVDASSVINDIMVGVELFNNGDDQGLRELISSESYYNNFVTLVRELAPDGDQVSVVQFGSKERSINFTRQRDQIELTSKPAALASGGERRFLTVEGTLDFATSRREDIIGLTTEDGTEYNIVIREGLDDMVRSYFKKWVAVTGIFDGKQIDPSDIKFVGNI